MPDINPLTGKLAEVNIVERRNVLASQLRVVQRQGQWNPGWDIASSQYSKNYILIDNGDLGLFSATTPTILAKNSLLLIMLILVILMASLSYMVRLNQKAFKIDND